ncbi:MAG: hypothetical protein ACREB9_00225 [Thermoplasmata archaeon]
MARSADVRWGLAVLAGIAGAGLALVGLWELFHQRGASAGAAQPAALTMPAVGLTMGESK